ncbi:hypothetical protein DSO57_1023219 [Entomophthora muscae]|uniref:Uncharacterized protein n=2 Tax=Entomophthora muscae TaxID=34485 RepID=A0ACC2TE12_9FUNG|nr:hypothetical protein DSO57_1023219 [Entomophthora muscae]
MSNQSDNQGFSPSNDIVEQRTSTEQIEDTLSTRVATYCILFMQGLCTVLPWNIFITGYEFFHHEFKGSSYENNFQNYFSVIFMATQLIFLIPAIMTQSKDWLYRRIFINVSIVSLVFLCLAIFPHFEPSGLAPEIKFFLMLIPLILCGILGVFSITDVYGLASMFPPIYIQGVMIGQALGGIAVSLIQLSVTLSNFDNEVLSTDLEKEMAILSRAKAYFGVALIVALCTLGSLVVLPRLSTYRRYVLTGAELVPPVEKDGLTIEISSLKNKLQQIRLAFRQVRLLALAVILNFAVTLGIFPSITSAVTPVSPSTSPLYQSLFVPVHFVIFNLGDFIGRLILGFSLLRLRRPATVLAMSSLRVVFFLVFLTSHLDLGSQELSQRFPVWVSDDTLYYFFLFLFSVSSGYIGSGSMVLAPSLASSKEDIPLIGNVMAFSLTTGLAIGSFLSFALRAAVCDCNSFLS